MGYPDYVTLGGKITPEGQKLTQWMEATLALYDKPGTDANMQAINRLDTSLQFYWTSVLKMKSQQPYSWLKNFKEQADYAWDVMESVEKMAVTEAMASEYPVTNAKVTEIAGELTKLKEALAKAIEKIDAQDAELDALKAKKSPGRPKKDTPEEGDTEA